MNVFLSIIISFSFMIQSYAMSKVAPMLCHTSTEISTSVKVEKQTSKQHSCCTLKKENQKSSQDKNDCGSDINEGCCCVSVLSIPLQILQVDFILQTFHKDIFGYQFYFSEYSETFFHPPIMVA